MIITLQTLIFFRESILKALDRILRPYYKRFSLTFGKNGDVSDDESDEQVFAEFDEEKGVVFYPPVYLQRYAAVSDCLMDERWCGKLDKVVDLGYHDMSFIKYLKEVSGIRCILGVDIESIPLRCSSDLMGCDDYGPKRENPLQVTLFQGNAADPDYRLIGCDAVIAIEMIEHMLPQDLDRLVHTVFGFIKPWVAIFSTPNGDFNVLFKAMEKNGMRRWDHFFEWSREQFHDWCSNIVARYPEYTVSCKGIGPGPPGTLHLGCCSQMAVFISKDYHKQQDLNLDSLALVANAPSPYNVSELIDNWDSAEVPLESNMMCPPNNDESLTELNSEKQSCVTILIASPSPTYSLSTLEYQDKTSQCNLDSEAGRNYMMFDYEQMCFDVVVPRRKMDNRVYMIEDVTSRLNCTTLQVKKFSKTTQNLIAKNKVDSLVHTREVVDEIRYLTKMLNFKKDNITDNGTHIWHNINWGDNAPYWNQYYKVVREYNPPYESKSEESRITELICDEINRLIDSQFDDDLSTDANRLEIPIEHLMGVVAHITDDVDRVKDLLEWDGYEIVDNVVIHSRLVVDTASASLATHDDDWPDNDTYSDWDSTEIRSTTMSDGSTIVPDYHARCLHRALDQKVRKLRTMLTADEDITTELDRIVCRLMKLALRTSKGRRSPPPTRWMQCKLLDLLTLTEKAIERRKRYFIENYPLKSISYDDPFEISQEMIALEKIKEDDTALKIVDKYRHLVQSEKTGMTSIIEESRAKYSFIDLELVDDLSATSAEFLKDNEYIDRHSPSLYDPEPTITDMALFNPDNEKTKLERTQAWLEDDIEVVPYPDHNHDLDFDNSSGDTDHSTSKLTRYYKKSYRKYKNKKQCIELKCVICKRSHSKTFGRDKDKKVNTKNSKTKVIKKVTRKKSNYSNMYKDNSNKYLTVDYKQYRVKPRKKEYKSLHPTASKPIPASLIELCHPELMIEDNMETYKEHIINYTRDDRIMQLQPSSNIAATEKSILIDIVMDDIQETIALRRTIGTDAEGDPMGYENETLIRSVSNTVINDDHFFDSHDVGIENDQTIFLDDVNEPSTSKGIRHVSMDVQCGPDNSAPTYSILSATTSITRLPNIFTAGIKIVDSFTDTKINSADCCTSVNDNNTAYEKLAPRDRAIGITIKDSFPNVTEQIECSTMTLDRQSDRSNACSPHDVETVHETKSLKKGAFGVIIKTSAENVTKKLESSTMTFEQEPDQTKSSSNHEKSDVECETMPREKERDIKENVERVITQVESSTMTQEQECDKIYDSHNDTYTTYNTNLGERTGVIITGKVTDQLGCSTTTQEQVNDQTNASSAKDFFTETRLLKAISNEIKTDDSGSEFCSSIASISKSPTDLTKCLNSEIQIVLSDCKDTGPTWKATKYVRPKLCCGGVQVHSYRDKQTSEDIMYQGEWQNNRPKVLTKRKIYNPVITKRIIDSNLNRKISSKDKISLKNSVKRDLLKSSLTRNLSPTNYVKKDIKVESLNTSPTRSLSPTARENSMKKNVKLEPLKSFTTRPLSPATVKKENTEINARKTIVPKSVTIVNRSMRSAAKVPSKLTMSSATSKNQKSTFIAKKPSISIVATTTNTAQKSLKIGNKNYLPFYLRKNNLKPSVNGKKNLNVIVDSAKGNINLKENTPRPNTLTRSKTEEIKRDLLKFHNKVPALNFVVLRNEIENKSSANDGQQAKSTPDNGKRRGASNKRPVSPQSQNSSTCSSNSIATLRAVSVRPKSVTYRRFSAASYKNSANSESENTTPNRTKKFTKRTKSVKMPDEKTCDNKENVPETSRQNISTEACEKIGAFVMQNKDVFIAQLKESPPLQSAANKSHKSNVKIPGVGSLIDKTSTSPSISKRSSLKSDDWTNGNENSVSASTEISNMVLVLEPQMRNDLKHESASSGAGISNNVNSRLISEWMHNSTMSDEESHSSNIKAAMRRLVEETLDFIDGSYYNNCSIDSETVILSREDLNNAVLDLSSSPISFKTVITNEDGSLKSELEQALNRCFDTTVGDDSSQSLNDTNLTVTDFDLLSFKSITSVSKHSEYLSADNSLLQMQPLRATSVKDIYERKDQAFLPMAQNTAGAIAIQAFSGFSINGETIAGDKRDPINFIDSETGSMTVDVSRQANSEELLISGRSTDSFESCLVDEEAVVPSWLFQIISQQQAAEDEANPPQPLQLPLQMPEDEFDDNGNVVEGVGLDAGAGDGRGIHSDQSQDSSGRGTSLSSSATSSGASEAILIDPSAFVAQFDGVALLEDSADSSIVVLGINGEDNELAVAGPIPQSFSRGEARRNPRVATTTASDFDADISSLETDVPDSSDN